MLWKMLLVISLFSSRYEIDGRFKKKMPYTSATFLIGCIAISGIPPLAGFWSKDEILGNAFISFPAFWFIGLLTAGMTAFYMFRLYFLTFEGNFREKIRNYKKTLISSGIIWKKNMMKKKN